MWITLLHDNTHAAVKTSRSEIKEPPQSDDPPMIMET